jgi:hypothetical protein
LTQLVIERILRKRSEICWPATVLLGTAGITALLLQPFLLLDPRETYFGLFGDLFNPERHPFERGLHGVNASIIVLYYLPHGMGWIVGGLAVVGGLHLLYWGRVTARWILFAFVFWSLLALLSVERIFLRYLDPLLPVVSVMAGHAVAAAARRVASGEKRLVISVAAVVAAASPNLLRDVVLDHRLSQRDSRALAGDWIVQNVPPGSRILWTGFGQTPPHLTMPRLQMCAEHDERLVALRAARGLPTRVDHAIMEWKKLRSAPCYDLQSLSIGSSNGEQRSFEAFPFVDHQYDLGCLEAIDRWSRSLGWLIGETPRVDLVHRFLAGVVSKDLQDLANGNEPILVVTGMPADPQLLQSLAPWFEQVQEFSPGHSASALYRQGAYDQGDAWFLPNLSLHRVDRPGVDIHVFRRRSQ